MSMLGCFRSDRLDQPGTERTDSNHLFNYNHGAKILVQYIPGKDETNVYHYIPRDDARYKDPPFKPDLSVEGHTVVGRHSIELFDMVSFSGRIPATVPSNTSLTIIHGVTKRSDWHFPLRARLTINADTEQFEVPVYSQMELTKPIQVMSSFMRL